MGRPRRHGPSNKVGGLFEDHASGHQLAGRLQGRLHGTPPPPCGRSRFCNSVGVLRPCERAPFVGSLAWLPLFCLPRLAALPFFFVFVFLFALQWLSFFALLWLSSFALLWLSFLPISGSRPLPISGSFFFFFALQWLSSSAHQWLSARLGTYGRFWSTIAQGARNLRLYGKPKIVPGGPT